MALMFSSTGVFSGLSDQDLELGSKIPLWLKELRSEDRRFLGSADISSFKGEGWKYTDPRAILKKSLLLSENVAVDISAALGSVIIDGACNVIVANGAVSGWHSLMPGVVISEGMEALDLHDEDRQRFSSVTRNDAEFFVRLNRALLTNPLSVVVERGHELKELIHIIHVVSLSEGAVFPRVFIRAGDGSTVNILQTYIAMKDLDSLSVPVTDIVIGEGAKVEYAERHVYFPSSSHIGSVRIWQKKASEFRSFISTAGAGLFRHNLSVMLQGEGASASVNGLHALQGVSHADSHTFIEHCVPHTSSNQLYKCVLQGASRSVFNGMVFVHPEAQQTNSYQLNKNLLLSRECRVDTKPQLEIFADDVKCTHGATIGQLDKEHLFYLQTRAIAREDAVRMLVRGFIDDVLSRVKHPKIREALNRG